MQLAEAVDSLENKHQNCSAGEGFASHYKQLASQQYYVSESSLCLKNVRSTVLILLSCKHCATFLQALFPYRDKLCSRSNLTTILSL